MSGGDLNAGLEGNSNMYLDLARLFLYDVSGGFKPAKLGLEFGGDFIFQITPTFGIGIGSKFIQASKKSTMVFTSIYETVKQSTKPQYNATSMNMGLFFTMPVSRTFKMVVNGGAGYYLARANSLWNLDTGGISLELSTDVKAHGFGITGGISFEFKTGRLISFFVECSGRYAKIGKFNGTGTEKSDGYSKTISGKLYYFETQNWSNDRYYPDIFVFDPLAPPINPPSLSNMREAKIDYSGVSINLGLIIHIL